MSLTTRQFIALQTLSRIGVKTILEIGERVPHSVDDDLLADLLNTRGKRKAHRGKGLFPG